MRKIFLILIALVLFMSCVVFLAPNLVSVLLFLLSIGVLFVGVYDVFQTKHSLLRSFPIAARLRWVFEAERDKIKQYFIESDLDGTPINRERRSLAYQRAKKQTETIPFGTQLNVYAKGYEFLKHSLFPVSHHDVSGDRIVFGSNRCSKKYSMSIINISAMSFGSLSKNAIKALNLGAHLGLFAHNTGEGGISPYHLQGGDLIFQVGTGYFGAGITNAQGKRVFDDAIFKANALRSEVKMIEIKLSQGAKPGHGGILPAQKNTKEIAAIRSVEPFTRVDSPPFHTAFSNYIDMLSFIERVRALCDGKPVGIKLCVGNNEEIEALIKIFSDYDSYPDFITVDGGEGGTGSAPLEFSNYVGTPVLDGLAFVVNTLKKYGLKDKIKIIASGKAVNAFDVVKLLAMGADTVNMARSFMLSLGCIQARECNLDTCPVGIATQHKDFVRALVVSKKYMRVKNFQEKTVFAVKELVGVLGLDDIRKLEPKNIHRRMKNGEIKSFESIYY